jgi:hypothetical protein
VAVYFLYVDDVRTSQETHPWTVTGIALLEFLITSRLSVPVRPLPGANVLNCKLFSARRYVPIGKKRCLRRLAGKSYGIG